MISFSFIIPVYNSELYLKRCLDSLLNQDLDNIEIIAVNDGSTDSSLEILNTYKTKYPNIFKVISQENKGIGPARNVGIREVLGEYIWFIDNDDCICPNCLQNLYTVLKETDCDILDIGFIHENYENNPLSQNENQFFAKKITQKYAFYFKHDYPWSKIYKRNYVVNLNVSFPDVYGEDTATIYWLYAKTNKIYEIANNLYAWFDRESSFSNHVLTSKHFNTFPKMIEILQNQMNQVPQFTEEFEYIIQSKVQMIVNYFKENKADSVELEREKENSIKKVEDLIKSDDENFYIYLNKYINKKVNSIVSSYESTLSWKLTKPIRKTKQILRKLLNK